MGALLSAVAATTHMGMFSFRNHSKGVIEPKLTQR
jgi:hypothetical protein